MTTTNSYAKRILATLQARQERMQWEAFIVEMLQKLELSEKERTQAIKRYEALGRHVATKMGIANTDTHVFVQGSMRTQTTVSPRGSQKFDLDIVVKMTGPKVHGIRDSEQFFQNFGSALKGVPDAGDPVAKRRCWRLNYPGEPFYFDVTPALPDSRSMGITTDLRVRDPDTQWSPSNPEEFANWFCNIANKRFVFHRGLVETFIKADTQVAPIPVTPVGIDDILRRGVQLIKLHRDNYYWNLPDARKDAKPISVILVTLAGHAYNHMVTHEQTAYSSPIEVLLELVDRMPRGIATDGRSYRVSNPALSTENFADRWNSDGGLRAREFKIWQQQLRTDLEALFTEEYSKKSEARIRSVFGQYGVDAWKASMPSPLQGLLAAVPGQQQANPTTVRPQGSKNTLA
ncbi:nucleotidyltransferase [Chitinimonas sp. BJYL2]|uniref:nucleotidyltransferase domain-containing protein n=1 Tax=Chitinimonas sp. BJYL2 TaxID=2976696 RepID=UPI0022B2EA36|nr:nucleotidyltransferase [Chitinimonas sp. BJYL2]